MARPLPALRRPQACRRRDAWTAAGSKSFARRFNAYAAARLKPEDFLRQVTIDAVLEIREISERSVDEVFTLAPFGHGNPAPLFAATNVEIAGPPAVWKRST